MWKEEYNKLKYGDPPKGWEEEGFSSCEFVHKLVWLPRQSFEHKSAGHYIDQASAGVTATLTNARR